MGEPNPMISHFSHGHPLELTTCQQTHTTSFCSGCTLSLSGLGRDMIYTCRTCNYFLHLPCAQAPQLILHPAHPNHTLTLLPRPPYSNGSFNCNACDRKGTGFSYHCVACKLDLHVQCVSVMPLSRHYQAHRVCRGPGFALPNPSAQCPHHHQYQMPPMVAPAQFQDPRAGMIQQNYSHNNYGHAHQGPQPFPPMGGGQGIGWGGVVVGQLVGGTAQGVAQGLVQDLMGQGSNGGGGGGGEGGGEGGGGGNSSDPTDGGADFFDFM